MSGRKGTVLVGLIVVLVLLVLVCGQLAKRSMPVSSELRVELPPGQKLVALTFDDGPHPEYTRALLDGLKEREIRAILSEMPSAQEIRDMLALVGLDMAAFYEQYGQEKIDNAVLYAKDLKDR